MARLGRAVSIIVAHERHVHEMHCDVDAFHAPSECHDVVARGAAKRFRLVRRHACHVAGVKNLHQLRVAIKRACPTWERYNHFRLGIGAL